MNKLSLLLTVFIVIVISCSKSDDQTTPPPGGGGGGNDTAVGSTIDIRGSDSYQSDMEKRFYFSSSWLCICNRWGHPYH